MTASKRNIARVGAVALAAIMVGTLAGCSGDDAPAELSDEPVTIGFTFWGGDARVQDTAEALAAFEATYDNISVDVQSADWTGYWDQLATQTAAGEMPDLVQMSDLYVSSYADRGTLRDLEELDIDTSKIDPAVLDLGRVGGTLYGITHGTGMYALVANVDLFEEYGVELPDDDTWTWDDYAAVAQELTEKSDGAITGSDQTGGFDVHGLRYWIRSAGGELFDDEGDVAMDPQALADMWQFELDLQESGGMLSASAITESFNAGISGNALASKQVALGVATDNQLTALQESTGSELRLLKLPEPEGVHPAFFGPTMYWSVATTSKHPAEAALLADFLANSQAAGEIIQTERGLPANSEVRAAISADLPAAAQAAIEFEESVETGEAPLVAPNGASTLETILQRYTQEVLAGQSTPLDAAEAFAAELQSEIDNAR
jgi:multiple sugar transport system substrate-binding protein